MHECRIGPDAEFPVNHTAAPAVICTVYLTVWLSHGGVRSLVYTLSTGSHKHTVFAGILPKSSRQERRENEQQEAETEENTED